MEVNLPEPYAHCKAFAAAAQADKRRDYSDQMDLGHFGGVSFALAEPLRKRGGSKRCDAGQFRVCATGSPRTVTTNSSGLCGILSLRPAVYDITLTADGFKKIV